MKPCVFYIQKKEDVLVNTREKIVDVIAEQLTVEKEKIVPSASFVDDLGADSLDLVELVMALEEVFGCEIADADAEKITTVQSAFDFIEKNIKDT